MSFPRETGTNVHSRYGNDERPKTKFTEVWLGEVTNLLGTLTRSMGELKATASPESPLRHS